MRDESRMRSGEPDYGGPCMPYKCFILRLVRRLQCLLKAGKVGCKLSLVIQKDNSF